MTTKRGEEQTWRALESLIKNNSILRRREEHKKCRAIMF